MYICSEKQTEKSDVAMITGKDLATKLSKYASATPHNTNERSYKVMDKKTKNELLIGVTPV